MQLSRECNAINTRIEQQPSKFTWEPERFKRLRLPKIPPYLGTWHKLDASNCQLTTAQSRPIVNPAFIHLQADMAAMESLLLPRPVDMDDESYEVMLKLMLEDAREISSRSSARGKQREGTVSDTELAFSLYAQELDTAATSARDRRLSRSLQSAVRSDADILHQFQQEERMARHDHAVAVALSEGREPPPAPSPTHEKAPMAIRDFKAKSRRSESDTQAPKRPRPIDLDVDEETEGDVIFLGKRLKQGESSSWAASRKAPLEQPRSQRRPCTSCMDQTAASGLIQAPCGHEYCHECLTTLFRSAMHDETLFPPQCCRQPIPVKHHASVLGATMVHRYHERRIEFSTVNRTYCHDPHCAAFVIPGCIEDNVGLCLDCGSQTCVHCKRAAHSGDCPLDQELQRVLQMARKEGWQRCFRCNTMVELNHGCYHLTLVILFLVPPSTPRLHMYSLARLCMMLILCNHSCRCRAEFCYRCSVPWKGCTCPLWEEGRLINRAAEIDQRHNGDNEDPQQGERIDRIMDNLREIHDCNHEQWRRIRGRFQCEMCDDVLPYFIYECGQCQTMACQTCKFNRL